MHAAEASGAVRWRAQELGPGTYCIVRHVMQRISNPHLSRQMATYDVTITICQAWRQAWHILSATSQNAL